MALGACLIAAWGSLSSVAAGQPTQVVAASGFSPGGQELFVLDFTRTPIGGFPSTIRRLSGNMEVVTKDGMPMLRALEKSEFLITLPGGLPPSFTIEVDIVPKECCPPPDLTLEGTARINQGVGSAHLLWTADGTFGWVGVVGGATDNREFQIPDEIRATLPGALTRVAVSVEGRTIKFYTNGRELYAIQAQFARGSVLRITLGGQTEDEGGKPVYLARIRVATGAPVTVAEQKSGLTASGDEPPPPVTGIVPRVGSQGDASVTWSAIPGVTSYFVVRWKVDDAACCSNFSPPEGLNRLDWADGVLPMAGTYAYRVYATTPTGISTGEATVTYQPIAPVAPTINKNPATMPPPPAPRTIDLSEVTAAGGFGTIDPRTIEVAGVTAAGSYGAIAQRTIALPEIQGSGGVRSTARVIAGAPAVPAPRTIAVAELLGTGGFGAIKPRTIALLVITASGGLAVPLPRTINLAGWTAAGRTRTPQED